MSVYGVCVCVCVCGVCKCECICVAGTSVSPTLNSLRGCSGNSHASLTWNRQGNPVLSTGEEGKGESVIMLSADFPLHGCLCVCMKAETAVVAFPLSPLVAVIVAVATPFLL